MVEVIRMNGQVLALRVEYGALVAVADGLLDVIHNDDVCNALTLAEIAHEARDAARKIASEIERLIHHGVDLLARVAMAVVGVAKTVAALTLPVLR